MTNDPSGKSGINSANQDVIEEASSRMPSHEAASIEEIKSVVHAMISPIVSGKPNIDELARLLKDIPAMVINIKNFGYDLALRMSPGLAAVTPPSKPEKIVLKSKATTSEDIESPWQAYWCKRLGIKPTYHRKNWELCYVAQAIWQSVDFEKSPNGIGFGCGAEPMASLFASMGATITVTDQAPHAAAAKGWINSGQHTQSLDKSFRENIIDRETFQKRVTLEYVDMNAIPKELHGKFDFCWSICSLEHLGSIQHGLDFIANSLRVLKPGGVAVHTTEFNFTDEPKILDHWPTVVFRTAHFEQVHLQLSAAGYTVCPLDFNVGNKPVDYFIDLPPYSHEKFRHFNAQCGPAHLKLAIEGIPSTCFGLIITAP